MNIPYALPFIGEEEIQGVVATLKSGWLSRGPRTKEFEECFASLVGSPYAVGINSCTAGLHLAQKVLGIGPGDEVITSPYTFIATANSILHCGATPVFVDIDPITMNLNVQEIERHITPKTKAIIPVHFAGFPCEMDMIRQIADHYKLYIIEDAAHAFYTKYKDSWIGSIGDITCFSFYATKNLATGEGGMVTTANEEAAERMRVMGLHGMSKNAWNRYAKGGSWFYEVEYPGYKYNMTDIQAALGLAQLQRMEEMQSVREQYARMYSEAFSSVPGLILPYDSPEHRHAWHLYVVRLGEGYFTIKRDELIEELSEAGIGTSVHFIPVPVHPYYERVGYKIAHYPHTLHCYETALSLPLYPKMTREEVEYVINVFLSIVTKNRR